MDDFIPPLAFSHIIIQSSSISLLSLRLSQLPIELMCAFMSL